MTSAKPNSQTWYLGSAPDLTSSVLHRMRARGRAGHGDRLSYREHSADPEANHDDPAAWRQANPGYPDRISDETILSERRSMSDEMFARERLSISPDLMESGGPFGPAWLKVCDPDITAKPGMFALDVNPERSAAAIVACGPGPIISVVDYRPGTSWIVDRCKELKDRYHCRIAIDKTGPGGSFISELTRQRVRLLELDATEMTRAAGHLFDAVRAGQVQVRTNEDLDRAVSGAVQRPVGDAWAWGRKHSAADISLLVAATAALWGQSQKQRAKLVSMSDLVCPKCGGIKADCGCEV